MLRKDVYQVLPQNFATLELVIRGSVVGGNAEFLSENTLAMYECWPVSQCLFLNPEIITKIFC